MAEEPRKAEKIMVWIVIAYLVCFLIYLVVRFYIATFPFGIALTIGGIVYASTYKSTNLLLKALAQTVLPLTIGVAVLSLTLLLLNVFEFYQEDLEGIKRLDAIFLNSFLFSKNWLSISFWQFLAIVLVLFVVNIYHPRWRTISGFAKYYKWVNIAVFTCFVLSSFSFFSTFGYEHHLEAENQYLIDKYELVVRENDSILGGFLAAKLLIHELDSIPEEDKTDFKNIFEDLNERTNPYPDYTSPSYARGSQVQKALGFKEIVADRMAEQVIEKSSFSWKSSLEVGNTSPQNKEKKMIERPLNHIQEVRQKEGIIKKYKEKKEENIIRVREATKAVEVIFSNALGFESGFSETLGNTYYRKLAKEYGKRVFKNHIVERIKLSKRFEEVNWSRFDIKWLNTQLYPQDHMSMENQVSLLRQHDVLETEFAQTTAEVKRKSQRYRVPSGSGRRRTYRTIKRVIVRP